MKFQYLSVKIINNNIVLPRSKHRLSFFFKDKVVFLQKGLFWRSLVIRKNFKKNHIGMYIFSRKPFSRIFLKKGKRR